LQLASTASSPRLPTTVCTASTRAQSSATVMPPTFIFTMV
jgi:hypothetical protein